MFVGLGAGESGRAGHYTIMIRSSRSSGGSSITSSGSNTSTTRSGSSTSYY